MCRDKIDVIYSTADKTVKYITFKPKKWQILSGSSLLVNSPVNPFKPKKWQNLRDVPNKSPFQDNFQTKEMAEKNLKANRVINIFG